MKIHKVFGLIKVVTQATSATTLLFSPLLLATLLMSSVSAELVGQPAPVYQVEFTSINDKTLYIRGGINLGYPAKQLYSLDISPLLTYSNQLTWRKLNEAGPILSFRADAPLAIDRENQLLLNFGEGRVMAEYNIALNRWSDSPYPVCFTPAGDDAQDSVRSTQTSMMDPKTGLIYIPLGWAGTDVLVYKIYGKECSSLPMPPSMTVNNYAWSESRDTMYMFGDTIPASGPTMWEFQFASKTWKKLSTIGTPPPLWADNCMTSGNQLIFALSCY
ncbi:MAG: hypothetical protein J3R72DRAFT_430739 [Linnemannia gamsii]|nr:MAG: hypothetical protein J3R72DRAFT_430739 [Linnemannia gamsii]